MSQSHSDEQVESSVERRRLRMRLAQRKHRAKQEQRVQDLENEIDGLHRRIEGFQTNFDDLEANILALCANDSHVAANLKQALGSFREKERLQPSPYQDLVLTFPSALPLANQCTHTPPQPFSDLSLQLFDYCTRLGFRILCARDSSSLRLARRIFHHRLSLDAHRGEETNLNYLRDCLGMWSHKLDISDDKGERFARKCLTIPRWTGFSDFLDVTNIEEYLTARGVSITNNTVLLPVRADQNTEYERNTQSGFLGASCEQPRMLDLPFGLIDEDATQPSAGLLTPPNLQIDEAWMDFEQTFPPHDAFQLEQTAILKRQVQVSTRDLIERLALSAICMGGPGPGFLPSDIDAAIDSLRNMAT